MSDFKNGNNNADKYNILGLLDVAADKYNILGKGNDAKEMTRRHIQQIHPMRMNSM